MKSHHVEDSTIPIASLIASGKEFPFDAVYPTILHFLSIIVRLYIIITIIICHDLLPPPRMGSHVKSDNTHTVIQLTPFSP